ncbi:MAG: cupin domain-containing protein [Actinomycetota bacterium]|nr:cupin domain-containing protein [Actinomycetota bacterium]
MASLHGHGVPSASAFLTPEIQQAVWFLGALVRIRVGGDSTGGSLAVLEHYGERGYCSPLHRHEADEELFFVLEGQLRVEVDGQQHAAGPGAVAVLPRALPHAFVVTSPHARFLTFHTPAGFERFTLEAGTATTSLEHSPPNDRPLEPAALAEMASAFGIQILGPPPTP